MGANEFTFLSAGIQANTRGRIEDGLEQNLDDERVAYGISSNKIDVHLYPNVAYPVQCAPSSFPRKRESMRASEDWMPACAGMTG